MWLIYIIPKVHPISGRYGSKTLCDDLGAVLRLKLVAICKEHVRVERKKEQRQ